MLAFINWFEEVDNLCKAHLLNDWQALCGNFSPLAHGFMHGVKPLEFVVDWAKDYDLLWYAHRKEGNITWIDEVPIPD